MYFMGIDLVLVIYSIPRFSHKLLTSESINAVTYSSRYLTSCEALRKRSLHVSDFR